MCLAKWASFSLTPLSFIWFHYPLSPPLFFILLLLASDQTSLWLLVGATSPSSSICWSTSVQQMLQPTVLCWVEFWHFVEALSSRKWQLNPFHEKLSPWKDSDLIFSSICCGLATCLLFFYEDIILLVMTSVIRKREGEREAVIVGSSTEFHANVS